MAGYETIVYKGKTIYYFDHEGLRGEALLENIKAGNNMILQAESRDILTLANFTDTYASDEILKYLTGPDSKMASKKIKKSAVLGVTGIKKIFLNMYNLVSHTAAKPFDDLESAKEYLVS